MSLNVSAIFPASPVHEPGSRTEKSPARMVCKQARIMPRSGETFSAARLECPLFFVAAAGEGSEFAVIVAAERSLRFTVASCTNSSLDTGTSESGGPTRHPRRRAAQTNAGPSDKGTLERPSRRALHFVTEGPNTTR